MSRDDNDDGDAKEPDGVFWIEILSWDWFLSIGLSSNHNPPEHRFQGGLDYVRSFDLLGRVLSPAAHRGDRVRIWISPFNKEIWFGPDALEEVGRLYKPPSQSGREPLRASLMLPEDAVAPLGTCLGSVSKYLLVSTFDSTPDEECIDRYGFSATLPKSVMPWAAASA